MMFHTFKTAGGASKWNIRGLLTHMVHGTYKSIILIRSEYLDYDMI